MPIFARQGYWLPLRQSLKFSMGCGSTDREKDSTFDLLGKLKILSSSKVLVIRKKAPLFAVFSRDTAPHAGR